MDICNTNGEPYWIRTNDPFLKSKIHIKEISILKEKIAV